MRGWQTSWRPAETAQAQEQRRKRAIVARAEQPSDDIDSRVTLGGAGGATRTSRVRRYYGANES